MEKEKIKQMIKLCVAITFIVIILTIVAIIMIKYEVEGDKNMPFNLTKVMIVSTAEGVETNGKSKWNFNIYQNNDLYLYFDKNDTYLGDNTYIEKIRIEDIQIVQKPQIGEIKAYMPNSVEGRLYSYDKAYIIEDTLVYKGAGKSNSQTLEIGNQGGSALIRFSNVNLGTYSSNEDKEIIHDGRLLTKLNLTEEQIQFKISFNLIIEVKNHEYKANLTFDLPCKDIISQGTSNLEKTDMSDIIFKRRK